MKVLSKLWGTLWLPFIFVTLFLLCVFVSIQHLSIGEGIDLWEDIA